jgi:hypothetical protein
MKRIGARTLTKEEIEEAQKIANDPASIEKVKEIIRQLDEGLTGVDLKLASGEQLNLAVLHHHTNALITGLEAIQRHEQGEPLSFPSQSKTPLPELAVKPLLLLKEVERLTGLSRLVLYEAIRSRKLKVAFVDHQLRVHRPDLDAFLATM